MSPTEVGKHYYERCLRILRELEAADDLAADLHMAPRGLVKITGRDDSLGRPVLYGTTRKFLQQFGLKSLKDLPKSEDPESGRDR